MSAQLRTGMWWEIQSTRVDAITWALDPSVSTLVSVYESTEEVSRKFEIRDVIGEEIRLGDHNAYKWNEKRSGLFDVFLKDFPVSGNGSYSDEWTIDRSTGKILRSLHFTDVREEPSDYHRFESIYRWMSDRDFDVGELSYWMIDPEMASLGTEISRPWVGMNGRYMEPKFSVSEADVEIKGLAVKVWDVSYSGVSSKYWHVILGLISLLTGLKLVLLPTDGWATEHWYYDKDFGVVFGAQLAYEMESKGSAGYITQRTSVGYRLVGSNMWCNVEFDAEPRVVRLAIDGQEYSLPRTFVYATGTSHTIIAPAELLEGDVRYVFEKWSNGVESNEVAIIAEKDDRYKAEYITQYRLSTKSEQGQPKGEGWYTSGSTATFSIQSQVSVEGFMGFIGVRYVFDHWTGDSNVSTSEATIVMDSPKTVEAIWRIDYTLVYIWVGLLILAIAVMLAIFKLRTRTRKKRCSTFSRANTMHTWIALSSRWWKLLETKPIGQ